MASFSGIATVFIDKLGVLGIGAGALLNGLGVPGISEVLLPLAGVSVRQGHQNLALVFPVVMTAQLIGLTLAFIIGRYGGYAVVERYGKYVFISHRELESAHRAFDKYGTRLVFVGAFVPGLQGFVGYIAGVAQMNYVRFLISVFAGKLVWNGGLLYLGYVLGNHLDQIDKGIKQVGVVVLAALVVLAVWYVYRHKTASAARNKEEN